MDHNGNVRMAHKCPQNRHYRKTCLRQPRSSEDLRVMGTAPQQLSTCSVLQPAGRCCSVLASLADTGCPQSESKLQSDMIVSFISSFSKRKQHTGATHNRSKIRKQYFVKMHYSISEKRDLRQTVFRSLVFIWNFSEGQLLAPTRTVKFHL